MTLTTDEIREADSEQGVRIIHEGVEYVVIRSERLQRVADGIERYHDELRLLLARSSETNGWDEPEMEIYDTYFSQP